MTRDKVRELLRRLHGVIIAEREHAKALDLEAMAADIREKEAIIQLLGTVQELHPDDRPFAEAVREENRRNAYLFKSTLNWIQDTMEFFGHKTVPATYGQSGRNVTAAPNGRLLSGRI